MILPILAVAVLVVAAGFFFQRFFAPKWEGPSASLEVLRERYARGDISREEFEEVRETLSR
jgi:uncharacterized membrane protein